MSQADWDVVSTAALELFAFGQVEAAKRGLLLVDTKYVCVGIGCLAYEQAHHGRSMGGTLRW